MAGELTGKVAIITGAANGIGRGTAELFIKEGAKVVIADLDSTRGAELADHLGDAAAFRRTDVSEAEDVQALIDYTVERFGGLHALFNNAGIQGNYFDRLDTDDLGDFQDVMAVNVLAVMLGCQRAARHMAANGGGSIINAGSIGGILPGWGVMTYRASKAAVNQLSKCLAIEYARSNIRVNCINPGAVPTDMTTNVPGLSREDNEALGLEMSAILMSGQLIQRRGSPLDIANMAMFLASDRSLQITGQCFAVDAGHSTGDPKNYTELMAQARAKYL
jgi:NAD(P)-dependent dehydrogenase (short-subunit alcohol dehydrogenase family)